MTISNKSILSGNNENESENERNLQQKNQNFMSPTISTTSKFTATTPNNKKKIFSEWKSPSSSVGKTGNSNSILRKSLPKPPLFSSPKRAVNCSKNNDEFDGTSDVPYDPLTNYLSPRPRFLRYRPDRKREFIINWEEKSGSESDNDSVGDCDDGLIEKESEEIEISDEISVVDEDNEDMDEFEEVKLGFKWVLLKSLIVFFGLILSTIFICSMNSSYTTRQYLGGFKIGDEPVTNSSLRLVLSRNHASRNWVFDGKPRSIMSMFDINNSIIKFVERIGRIDKSSEIEYPGKIDHPMNMNMSLRIVSLSSLDSGNRVLDEKTRSMKGVFESSHSSVEFDENLGNVKENEFPEKIESLDDYYQLQGPFELGGKLGGVDQISDITEAQEIEIAEKIESLDDFNQIQSQLQHEDNVQDGQVEFEAPKVGIPDLKNEEKHVEIEAPIIAIELVEGPGIAEKIESLDEFDQTQSQLQNEDDVRDGQTEFEVPKVRIPDSKNEDEQVEIEAPIVAIELVEGPGIEDVVGFNATLSGFELENGVENSTENSVVKPKEEELANEVDASPENQSETVELGPNMKETPLKIVEYGHLRLTSSDLIWSALSPVLLAFSLLGFFVLKMYGKCKRAPYKTRSSNVKFCSNAGKTVKSRVGLPPKSMVKTDQHQSNAQLLEKDFHSEMNPPPISVNPQENFDTDIHVIIPKVKQLGEFEVGMEFTQSVKRCVKSEMELKDESVFSTPNAKIIRRSSVSGRPFIANPSSSELSTAESYSYGSYISHDSTSMKDGKEEMSKATPTPRRSTRLRNKGVTSP